MASICVRGSDAGDGAGERRRRQTGLHYLGHKIDEFKTDGVLKN